MHGQTHAAFGDIGGMLTFAGGMPLLFPGIGVLILGVAVLLVIGHRWQHAASPAPSLAVPFVTAAATPFVTPPAGPLVGPPASGPVARVA